MQSVYLISFFLLFNISFSQDQLYTYDSMKDTLYAWQETYGNSPHPSNDYSSFGIIYSLDSIGYSSNDNLPIYAVKISDNVNTRETEPKVLILGQCHAEEIYGVEIAMEIINQFLHPDQYQQNKTFLQNGLYLTELWIVPTYNPEGLRVVHGYQEDGNTIQDVTYRKNKRDTDNDDIFDYENGIGQDTDGVDLNRNYDFNWVFGDTLLEPCTGDCSYADDYDYYRGEYPESESETEAIVTLAKEQNFLLSLAYHSSRSGRVDKNVVYPWAWEGKSTVVESPGFDIISDLGSEIAELLVYSYYGGSKSRRGNAHDWLYRETGCIQYLIEVGYTNDAPYGEGLLVELDHLDEVVESNIDAFFHLLMRAAGVLYHNEFIDQDFDGGNQVRGIVTDASTGFPIPGAIINIPELEGDIVKPRKTDSLGYYCRLLNPNQSYALAASAYGYDDSGIINIINSASQPTNEHIPLTPSPTYNLTFNIELPDDRDGELQLIIQDSFQSETVPITHGESINLPQGHYRLVLTSSEYIPQIFEINLVDNLTLSVILIDNKVVWEEDPSDTWNLTGELSIPLSSFNEGDSLIFEMNFRYELEWDYDNFSIDYINAGDTTAIMKFTGDNYKYYTEYIPFTIPEGHASGSFYVHLDQDDTIEYRGVEVDYIKIMSNYDIPGCTDNEAINYNPEATTNDGSCEYETKLPLIQRYFQSEDSGYDYSRGTYLIVLADASLESILRDEYTGDFIHFKQTQGYKVKLITFSEVGGTASYLRTYLQIYYENIDPMLEYVLLIGDINGSYAIPSYTISSYNESDLDVTDYPYTFFDNEDILNPSFFIGRWSIRSHDDLKKIKMRSIQYVKMDYLEDHSFLNNALLVAGNYSDSDYWPVTPVWTSKWLMDELNQFGYDTIDTAFFHQGNPQVNNPLISSAWNSGVGIINYRGWGDANGWHKPYFHREDVDPGLQNGFYLPVVMSFVCNTGDFGNDYSGSGLDKCFGEVLTTGGSISNPKGAAAMIGPSDLDTDTRFNNVLCAVMWDELLEGRIPELSPALHAGKHALSTEFLDLEVNGTNIAEFYHHVYGVLGDPSLPVWLGEPGNMTALNTDILLTSSHITTTITDVESGDALMDVVGALLYNEELIAKGLSNEYGELVIDFEDVPDNSILELYLNKAQYYQKKITMNYESDDGSPAQIPDYQLPSEEIDDIYIAIDSKSAAEGAPIFNWVEIDETGTNLNLTDDSIIEKDLGFNFQYYGENFNQLTVCSNGWASFLPCLGEDDSGSHCNSIPAFYNNSITHPLGPYGMLAPFFDDLDDNEGNEPLNVYFWTNEQDSVIVEWNNIANGQHDEDCVIDEPESCPRHTFQLILVGADGRNGEIIFQYNNVSNWKECSDPSELWYVDDHGSTIGIESPDKNTGTQYLFYLSDQDELLLHDSLAVKFSDGSCISTFCGDGVCNCGEEDASCPEDCAGCTNAVGDINGDEGWSVLDIVLLINCVLNDNCVEIDNSCAGDINGDEGWSILDIVLLINCVLNDSCGNRVGDATRNPRSF